VPESDPLPVAIRNLEYLANETCNTRWGLRDLKFSIRSMVVLALVAAVVPGVACAQSTTDSDEAAIDFALAGIGAEVYLRRCAACHGVDARGHGPALSALKVPPPDLTQIAHRRDGEFPIGEMARFIDGRFDLPAHGSREMPIWGERLGEAIPEASLGDEIVRGKIATLIEYLKSIQRGAD
jgi:mono/diheme cytochrome c family protein